MKVAVTGAAGFLGQALLPFLAAAHTVRASDLRSAAGEGAISAADVLDRAAMDALCDGMDAVVHLAHAAWDPALSAAANAARILDTRIKGTYTLLLAAADRGVKRVAQVSDLCVLSGYAAGLIVSEDFVPLPDTSAHQQAVYLSELVGREFARLHPGMVCTLRLGTVVDAGSLDAGAPFREDWLDVADAVAAILRALEVDGFDGLAHWGLYNLAADIAGSRFDLRKIRHGHFGFAPRQDFAAWRGEG
jgi:nucleoside-diphosphate-sugar epimerase